MVTKLEKKKKKDKKNQGYLDSEVFLQADLNHSYI